MGGVGPAPVFPRASWRGSQNQRDRGLLSPAAACWGHSDSRGLVTGLEAGGRLWIADRWYCEALARLVGREDHAGGGGDGVEESQVGDVVVVIEQALAGAEHERVDHQQVLVDEPVG